MADGEAKQIKLFSALSLLMWPTFSGVHASKEYKEIAENELDLSLFVMLNFWRGRNPWSTTSHHTRKLFKISIISFNYFLLCMEWNRTKSKLIFYTRNTRIQVKTHMVSCVSWRWFRKAGLIGKILNEFNKQNHNQFHILTANVSRLWFILLKHKPKTDHINSQCRKWICYPLMCAAQPQSSTH